MTIQLRGGTINPIEPIDENPIYQALRSVDVDEALCREAAEECLDRTTIPVDVTSSALYRALRSNGKVSHEIARDAVESLHVIPSDRRGDRGDRRDHPRSLIK